MARYQIITRTKNASYIRNNPLLILSYAITLDKERNEILFQGKFQNIGEKFIKAFYLKIDCFGIDKEPLEGLSQYEYLDLNIKENEIFGSDIAVYLPDNRTRSIKIQCKKIIFSDGSKWENEEEKKYISSPPIILIKDVIDKECYFELCDEIKNLDVESQKICIPQDFSDIHLCACGSYGKKTNDTCWNCKQTKDWWKEHISPEYLKERIKKRNQEVMEKKDKQLRLAKKIGIPAAIFLIALLLFSKIIFPNYCYIKANTFLKEESYDKAITYLKKIKKFKDSNKKLQDAKDGKEAGELFLEVEDALEEGGLAVNLDIREKLERLHELNLSKSYENRLKYNQGDYYFQTRKYKEAIDEWNSISDKKYNDLNEKIELAESHIIYREAYNLSQSFETKKAYEKLLELKTDVEDSENLRNQLKIALDSGFIGLWKQREKPEDTRLDYYRDIQTYYTDDGKLYFIEDFILVGKNEKIKRLKDRFLYELVDEMENKHYELQDGKLREVGIYAPKETMSLENEGKELKIVSDKFVANWNKFDSENKFEMGGTTSWYEKVE